MTLSRTLGFSALLLGPLTFGVNLQAAEPVAPELAPADQATAVTVHKSPSCGCCTDWVEHLEEHGFEVEVRDTHNMNQIKIDHQVPRTMASCHTAVIDGLVIEGHVPAADIRSFLANADSPFGDKTVGLAVPGMPHGSPGMETGRFDSYDVLAFTANGQVRSVKRYEY